MPAALGRQRKIELGIKVAQAMLDDKKKDDLKAELLKQYPLVPEAVVDVLLDETARQLQAMTPRRLRTALQPGELEKTRPKLRRTIAKKLVKLQVPMLKAEDQLKLTELLVDKVLDLLLEQTGAALTAPEVRLDELHEQVVAVEAEMSRPRLFWFHLKRQPGAVVLNVALWAVLASNVWALVVRLTAGTVVERTAMSALGALAPVWSAVASLVPTLKAKLLLA